MWLNKRLNKNITMEKKWICCTTEELGESWEVLADEKEKNIVSSFSPSKQIEISNSFPSKGHFSK